MLLPLGDFDPTGEGAIRLAVVAARWQGGEPVAASDVADVRFYPLQVLADVPLTPGARGWPARAIIALCPDLPRSRQFEMH